MAAPLHVETAIRKHGGIVRSLLQRSGLCEADAEDVAQEAFLVFAKRFDELPESAQRPFLVSTARRMLADWRRLARHRVSSEPSHDALVDETQDGPETVVARQEAADVAIEALSALTADERRLVILSQWLESSRTEIAQTLNLPLGTVASRLVAASKNYQAVVRQIQQLRLAVNRAEFNAAARRAPARVNPAWIAQAQPFGTRDVGELRSFNNQFGRGAARGSFDQCLLAREHQGHLQLGWSWHWPKHANTLAYPELLCGWSPWLGQGPSVTHLPVRVRSLRNMRIHYDVQTEASGEFALLSLVSLVRTPRRDGAKDPTILTSEIAVQLEMNGIEHRLGKPRASVTVGARDYSVWLWRTMGGYDPAGLPSYVFSDGQANRTGTIEVSALLDYLLAQRLVLADDWIACCELGNEVSGGHGTTWVKRFEVEIDCD